MAYRSKEFLTDDDQPNNRVRCPVHGFIRFSDNERAVIDHRLFRRLRYIRQLALTEFLYPGASHTRFEHSLGVMEVATRAFDSLAAKHGDVLESTFGKVEGFSIKPLAMARQSLRLAALLHDVGHSSFSHAAEKVVHKGAGHESLSVRIIREPDLLGNLLREKFGDVIAAIVSLLIEGGAELPPQMGILHDLISGQMDADRTDYLLRDSHHCGVDYGRFDYRRMIECIEVNESDVGELEVAIHRDGLHTFEALVLARYQMNAQVYFHRLRRIYDEYLLRYHQELAINEEFTMEVILRNNDLTMMTRILADAGNPDSGARYIWANRIAERRHHRLVHDTGLNANALAIKHSDSLLQWMNSRYGDREYIRDVATANIHKLLTREDQTDDGLVRMSVVITKSHAIEVGFESQVLSKIPRNFQCARIFADVEPGNVHKRAELSDAAERRWNEMGGA